jgi:hypothetical protein
LRVLGRAIRYLTELVSHILHIPRERLERYVLARIANEREVEEIEEHLLWCEYRLDHVEAIEQFVRLLRAGAKHGALDVELLAQEFKTWRTRMNDER